MKLAVIPATNSQATVELILPEDPSVEDLKATLDSVLKVPANRQRLYYNQCGVRVMLTDGWKLSFFGIKSKSVVYLDVLSRVQKRKTLSIDQNKKPSKEGVLGDFNNSIINYCKEGDLYKVSEILNYADEDDEDSLLYITDDKGQTLLHFAVMGGQSEITEYLLTRRANPNAEDNMKWTPLQLACFHGHEKCVELLLKTEGIQVNKQTKWTSTPLHYACAKENVNIVRMLVDAGANITLQNYQGKIPLEVTTNEQIQQLLPKYLGDQQLKKYLKDPPFPFSSKLFVSQSLFTTDKEIVLYSKPEEGYLCYYKSSISVYDGVEPDKKIPIADIQNCYPTHQKRYGNKITYHFSIVGKDFRYKFYSFQPEMTQEWIQHIYQAIQYVQVNAIPQNSQQSISFRMSMSEQSEPLEQEDSSPVVRSIKRSNTTMPRARQISEEEEEKEVTVQDFTKIEELGQGSYGIVYKVLKNNNNELYALKSLSKQQLIRDKQLKYAISESKILRQLDHPFIIKLHFAFQDKKNLYLVMDYCPGGDLANLIEEKGRLHESDARFYFGEVVLAFEYIHNLNIFYRDLKPANILIDDEGHVKLADFGLAKEGVNQQNPAKTLAGSPAYLAPEVFSQTGAGKAADIYALGVLLYEMLSGAPPFKQKDLMGLINGIQKGRLDFPHTIFKAARDLIQQCMQRQASKRPTINAIKRHEFFRKMDFNALFARRIRPPGQSLRTESFDNFDWDEQDKYQASFTSSIDEDDEFF